jgi:hypothetical protein
VLSNGPSIRFAVAADRCWRLRACRLSLLDRKFMAQALVPFAILRLWERAADYGADKAQ